MKRHSVKSLLVTFSCALLILALGYLGIVQGGRRLLHNESLPEQAKYENTSSNVFYGKIEDDIELYPWNYYSEQGAYGVPQFGMFYEESQYILEETFLSLIAENTGVSQDIITQYYTAKPVVQNLKTGEDDMGLQYYFFEDMPEFFGKKYQIKIACNNWSIQSVLCNEIRSKKSTNTTKWESGKEALIDMLEKNQERLEEQLSLLYEINYEYLGSDVNGDGNRIIIGIFNSMIAGDEEAYEIWINETKKYCEAIEEMAVNPEYQTDAAYGFSYQILERSDVILLLLQSDLFNIGIFYDPISMKFCGYSFL